MTDQPPSVPPPETAPEEKAGSKEERTFTQAELDRIIDERLKRERNKYADYADLKAAAEKLKTIEDAQKSEQQKLQDKLALFERQTAEAIAARTEATIRAAAKEELGKHVPADRISAAYKLLDKSMLKMGDGDSIDGLGAAVEAVIKENPFLQDAKPAEQPPAGPKIATMNPSGASQPGSGYVAPIMRKNTGNSVFTGFVVPPPGEGKK